MLPVGEATTYDCNGGDGEGGGHGGNMLGNECFYLKLHIAVECDGAVGGRG